MLHLKHKTFRSGPKFGLFWTEQSLFQSREHLREQAEEFALAVGAENVVSVTEEMMREVLMVTIWYREEVTAKASKSGSDEL